MKTELKKIKAFSGMALCMLFPNTAKRLIEIQDRVIDIRKLTGNTQEEVMRCAETTVYGLDDIYSHALRYGRLPNEKTKTIANIRAHLEAFGYDASQYTDDEIEDAMDKMQPLMAKVGVTTTQAAEALVQLGNTFEKGNQ